MGEPGEKFVPEKIPEEKISKEEAIDLLAEGNIAMEEENLEKALGLYQEALQIFKKILEKDPKDKEALVGTKEARGKVKETKKILAERLEKLKRKEAENLYGLGEKSITEGKYPEAISYFQRAVKEYPKLIGGWERLGALLTNLGNYEEAHRILKNGLRANQESNERWKLWNGLGKLFLQIGEFPRAYACLSEAKDLEKESFSIDYNLGIALLNLPIGDPTVNIVKAIEYLEKAEKKNPNSSAITNTKGVALFGLAQMGKSKENVAQYENALKSFGEAIEKNPKDMWGWYNKGVTLLILQKGGPTKERLKEANGIFDEVLRIIEGKEEQKETAADVWLRKAEIWKFWSDCNPLRERGQRNEDLKQCAKCLKRSLDITKPRYDKKILTEKGQETLINAQNLLTLVEAELKRIEEWVKFRGAKRVQPVPEFDPMFA
jgi:tetratricopeptide (TPR) repeat protein